MVLSSSSYGPEEAFKAIAGHTYLAIFLAIATAVTVFVISYTYSKIIEQFPHGGGGYIVATHTLGKSAGVVSGSALLIDYILTITVSIAACGDAIFSFLPLEYHQYSLVIQNFFNFYFNYFKSSRDKRIGNHSCSYLSPFYCYSYLASWVWNFQSSISGWYHMSINFQQD